MLTRSSMNTQVDSKKAKMMSLFFFIILLLLVFLVVMFNIATNPRQTPSLYTIKSSTAQRGSIMSLDGFHLAVSKKLYKAAVNVKAIDPAKKELFIKLFSIYSGIDANMIEKKINRSKGYVVLSYNISQVKAEHLKWLAYELLSYKVFKEITQESTGIQILTGLDIIESGETRIYPYSDLLSPIIGYTQKIDDGGYTLATGIKGVEKKFQIELRAKQGAYIKAPRDVNSYAILNRDSITKPMINGLDIQISIPVALQIKIEKMLDEMKEDFKAKEVMIAIMNSKTGELLSLATSNRFNPKNIRQSDYRSLNIGAIEYSFEPGSVIKPITFSLLLDHKLINPYSLVNGHNGRYRIGKTLITDEHKFDWLSAEDVIVHSSNIGIAQLANKLTGVEFHEGLKRFGFSQKSTSDLNRENRGLIPSAIKLENEIYRSRCSYGYGMKANLLQLLKAYSVFHNNGKMVSPVLVTSQRDEYGREVLQKREKSVQVITSSAALQMKKILVKTVNEGTGIKAKTEGLIVGGKTGTARIVENRRYVKKYNTSFIGFVEDKSVKLTLGVVVIQPQKYKFASQTAVPVFKNALDIMVGEGYLKVKNKEF